MLTMCQDAAQQLLLEGGFPPLPASARVLH
jgi:hypothetical protein